MPAGFDTLRGRAARRRRDLPPPEEAPAAARARPPTSATRAASRRRSTTPTRRSTLLLEAIGKAGYKAGEQIFLALDVAASEFFDKAEGHATTTRASSRSSAEMVELYAGWAAKYPLVSIEDGLDQDDWDGWKALTDKLGAQDPARRRRSVRHPDRAPQAAASSDGIANSILVKVNQIGTLAETLDAVRTAQHARYTAIISHRSGETEDAFIADLAVATNAGQIKTGSASRSDRDREVQPAPPHRRRSSATTPASPARACSSGDRALGAPLPGGCGRLHRRHPGAGGAPGRRRRPPRPPRARPGRGRPGPGRRPAATAAGVARARRATGQRRRGQRRRRRGGGAVAPAPGPRARSRR